MSTGSAVAGFLRLSLKLCFFNLNLTKHFVDLLTDTAATLKQGNRKAAL